MLFQIGSRHGQGYNLGEFMDYVDGPAFLKESWWYLR